MCRATSTTCARGSSPAMRRGMAPWRTCIIASRSTSMCVASGTCARSRRNGVPAPGRQQSDGRSLFVLGERFGNVFVGIQPAFGYEGDPMRLLFEKGFAPTHAFSAFYRWLREDFSAHAVLHFGTHGALEFMPGKQAGLTGADWPDRLIGDLPNLYLYAANNPSEGAIAKRRAAATLISYLTPPVAHAGLYRGLVDLKAGIESWRTPAARGRRAARRARGDDPGAGRRGRAGDAGAGLDRRRGGDARRRADHRRARARIHVDPARPARGRRRALARGARRAADGRGRGLARAAPAARRARRAGGGRADRACHLARRARARCRDDDDVCRAARDRPAAGAGP